MSGATLLALASLAGAADDYVPFLHVAPNGDDAWSGSLAEPNAQRTDGPIASLERMREVMTGPAAVTTLPDKPLGVVIHGGTYVLTQPLVLAHPFAWDLPVEIVAAAGEHPVISGGLRVTGWTRNPDGTWQAEVAAVKTGKLYPHEFFVNGRRCERARLPKQGLFTVAGLPGLDPKAPYNTPSDSFQFADGDLHGDWRNLTDVEVVVPHFWTDSHLLIASIDAEKRQVRFQAKSSRRFTDDHTHNPGFYWVENVAEALSAPGEWYLDRGTGVIRYLPRPGEDMTTADAELPALSELVRIDGDAEHGKPAQGIELRGLTLAYAEWNLKPTQPGDWQSAAQVPGAVRLIGTRDCAITDCTVAHCGTYGIEIGEGCDGIRLVGNEIVDLGAGGIAIGGGDASSPTWKRTGGVTASDNHLHQLGRVYRSGAGILAKHADRGIYSHNLIEDLFYSGISVGWVWGYKPSVSRDNLVEANDIRDCGQGMLSDLGGIYTLGPQPGTVIRGNRIHDIESRGYGGWGIYTDEGTSWILIERNLVYRTKSGGFHQHYGEGNVVRNNVFAFGRTAQLKRSKEEVHSGSFDFVRNIVAWKEGVLLDTAWDNGNYLLDCNCYGYAGTGEPRFAKGTFAEWQAAGRDPRSVIADPGFVDATHDDFALKPDSPALALGFDPLDLRTVGPRPREERR